MNGYGAYSEENQPVTYLNGYPLYAAHFIVAIFVACMLATTILMGLNVHAAYSWTFFSSERVLAGQIWRVVSYGLWNPPALQFVADMFMIVWFGREVEKFFGRRKFLILYFALYLLTPLLFTVLGLLFPLQLSGETGAFALFIAFATLYPNVPLLFNILAKWMAMLLVGMFSLMAIAYHDTVGLISLWATCGFAFAFVRYEQGVLTLPKFRVFQRKPKLKVLPDPVGRRTVGASLELKSTTTTTTMAEVDALLDKIAKSGIASLTPKERAKLEAARTGLNKRGAGRN